MFLNNNLLSFRSELTNSIYPINFIFNIFYKWLNKIYLINLLYEKGINRIKY